MLGEALAGQERYEQAEPLLIAGHQGVSKAKDTPPARRHEAVQRLVGLYEAWQKPDKAAEYRALLENR